jgi:Uma2 family endonuclease
MPATVLMSVEEYLASSFDDGDLEYVDGELLEYNMGEIDHGNVQGLIYAWFLARRSQLGVYPLVEVRTRVSPKRYRIPDISVVRGSKPTGRVITESAPLVIEVLSPEDRASRMEAKIDDYLRFGIGCVWVIDPETGNGHIYTAERRIAVEDGIFRVTDPAIEMNFAELFIE